MDEAREDALSLKRKNEVTTAMGWLACLFGLLWLVLSGQAVYVPFAVYLAYLGGEAVYFVWRTWLVSSKEATLRFFTPLFFLVDTSGLLVATAISGGSHSPFLPVFFTMPISGAFIYGAKAGVVTGVGSSLGVTLGSLAAARMFSSPFDAWMVICYVALLPAIGAVSGSLAERSRAALVATASAERAAQMAAFENTMTGKLLQRTIQTQEAERRRIAGDLHDGLAPLLAATKIEIGVALRYLKRGREPEVSEQLEDAKALLGQAISDTQRLLYDLRPVLLEDRGLASALASLVDRISQNRSTFVVLDCPRFLRLEPDVETAIFRIVQEALDNIRKHAQASRATVTLTPAGNGLSVVIEDDGVGFDPRDDEFDVPRGPSGLGLRSMRERAEYVGASFDIVSSPKRGTRIALTCPGALADGGHVPVASG